MTAYDESTGHPVIWRLMFVLLECLNIYTCLIFFTNILAYMFFHCFYTIITFKLFMRVFPFWNVSVQQWCVELKTLNCRYILR